MKLRRIIESLILIIAVALIVFLVHQNMDLNAENLDLNMKIEKLDGTGEEKYKLIYVEDLKALIKDAEKFGKVKAARFQVNEDCTDITFYYWEEGAGTKNTHTG